MFWAKLSNVGTSKLRTAMAALAFCGLPAVVQADQLAVEQREGEEGYTAVEELSYEAIIEASDGYAADLKLRIALHNNSESARDVVHSIALPFASQVTGVSVARDGVWTPGKATDRHTKAARRDPGSVYVRALAPSSKSDIPGAELVAFGIDAGATVQVEVAVRVYPQLRGDVWELDLPARGVHNVALAGERRVILRGLGKGEAFSIDGTPNGDKKYMVTRPEDGVTVSWPSHLKAKKTVEANFEVIPGPAGFDDGEFRLYLRLGQTASMKPDHVVVLLDRSRSTDGEMDRAALRMVDGLFDALPGNTTFEALAFNRRVHPLTDERPKLGKVGNKADRKALQASLAAQARGQGTDLKEALREAGNRARKAKGKTLIVVATDGMFPSRMSARDIDAAFDKAKGRKRPEVLFVVDEPMLQRKGIDPNHPVAKAAAAVGARISLEAMDQLHGERAKGLLGAPRVLGGLGVTLPKNAELTDAVPHGLVAGSFVLLRGRYVGKAPNAIKLRGHFGDRSVERSVKATTMASMPEALAATTAGDLDDVVAEGMTRPPWYRHRQEQDAMRGITRAGRHGYEQKGYLDQKIFRYYLTTRVMPRARVCYNKALTRHPEQGGRVVLEMEVGKGEVMAARTKTAELETGDAKLVECMAEAAWSLDIPAGKLDDQIYRLNYPLRLVPPEDGKSVGKVTQLSDDVMELLLGSP